MKHNGFLQENDHEIFSQLKDFATTVSGYIDNTDSVFFDISKFLPKIEKKIDDNLIEAKELIDFIFSTDTENKKFGVTHEIAEFHRELEDAVSRIRISEGSSMSLMGELNSSINNISKLIDDLTEILDFSENLKVFAINSITNSQKIGVRGSGYKIISDQFIKISEKISNWTEKISLEASYIKSLTSEVSARIEEHRGSSTAHFDEVSTNSADILKKTEKSVHNFSIILNDILARVNTIKDPTYNIMIKIQRQDIIKQQLVHVTEIIENILVVIKHYSEDLGLQQSDDEKLLNIYSLIDFLVNSTERQMRRIAEDLDHMLDELDAEFYKMKNSMEDIDEDKENFSDMIFAKEGEACAPIIKLLFESPRSFISAFSSDYRELINQKSQILIDYSSIENKIRAEKNIASDFPSIATELTNMLMLSKIEQARYKLNISDKDEFMSEEFANVTLKGLLDIIEEIDASHVDIQKSLKDAQSAFEAHKAECLEIEDHLRKSISILDRSEQLFSDNFKTVMDLTSELEDQIDDYIKMFNTLREMNQEINQNINVCSDLHLKILDKAEKLGGLLDISECHFKDVIFSEIIHRYTVEAERATIAEHNLSLDIESSSDDSITLF
ncbi:MAG: hypothetical protein JXR63_11415 [Spirochaetales bacterium]|nr:hypothetical protein [Spirochaetales bacterium]